MNGVSHVRVLSAQWIGNWARKRSDSLLKNQILAFFQARDETKKNYFSKRTLLYVRQLVQKERVYNISVDYPSLNIAPYTQTLHGKEW